MRDVFFGKTCAQDNILTIEVHLSFQSDSLGQVFGNFSSVIELSYTKRSILIYY